MRGLTAVLLGLGLGFTFDALGSDEVEEPTPPVQTAPASKTAPASSTERPRGVCHFSQPGLSMVIEDTTEEACRERQHQCGQDNPGHENECRSRWSVSDDKGSRVRKGKSAGKAERAQK